MEELIMTYEDKMEKSLDNLYGEYTSIRAGRANPHILDKITVDYYGSPTPLQQVGNISVPEARMIVIQPWEASILKDIEKALLSVMIELLDDDTQLFFTTHNTDILDMQLPKHSYTFMKKEVYGEDSKIECINAGEILKRSTDSLKSAVENDLFSSAPATDLIYDILDI